MIQHAPLAQDRDELARSYQPRRVWSATVSIAWNLAAAAAFVFSGAAERLFNSLKHGDHVSVADGLAWLTPLYIAILFTGYAIINFPLDLWIGYLEERQFGLAKDGIRAWARDWLVGTIQHGVMFLIGSCLIVIYQSIAPSAWISLASASILLLFLMTTWLAADLLPPGIFNLQRGDDEASARLRALLPDDQPLPPIVIFSHPALREFSGGIIGLANRQVLLVSRSTIDHASDALLRFVLLHDLGHRRYHHNLLSCLVGWAWVSAGLIISHALIPARAGYNTATFAAPLYIAYLALTMTIWMALGEPVLAYLGRRLEYQADRFYLRNGGTLEEMHVALNELAERNLARTELLRRRETIFHPLPSVSNRLHRAELFMTQG